MDLRLPRTGTRVRCADSRKVTRSHPLSSQGSHWYPPLKKVSSRTTRSRSTLSRKPTTRPTSQLKNSTTLPSRIRLPRKVLISINSTLTTTHLSNSISSSSSSSKISPRLSNSTRDRMDSIVILNPLMSNLKTVNRTNLFLILRKSLQLRQTILPTTISSSAS